MYLLGEAMASIGPFGGNIVSIAVDPDNPSTIYAATFGGGVFKSINGGNDWSPVGLINRDVNSLIVDPNSPNIIYAGTFLAGVFKSTDAGEHWFEINTGLINRNVSSLALNKTDSATLYAGTEARAVGFSAIRAVSLNALVCARTRLTRALGPQAEEQ